VQTYLRLPRAAQVGARGHHLFSGPISNVGRTRYFFAVN
jgi:hypothetical protein